MARPDKCRRKHKRIAKRLSVLIESNGTYTRGHIKNLSKTGLFLRSTVLPESGSIVRLKFETLEGKKIEVEGRVRWTTAGLPTDEARSGFGVLLENPGEDFRAFFASLAD